MKTREELLQAKYGRAVARFKRAESRMVRTFNAWVACRDALRRIEKLLERESPETGTRVEPDLDDDLTGL